MLANKILESLPGIQEKVPLKNYTTYKIGGPAKYFFVAKNKDDLIRAINCAKLFRLPIFILGGGSNLLISDKGFPGLVVKISVTDIEFDGNIAKVGAGASLAKIAYLCAENNLSGLEWAAGIPSATVGGSIYGHAQAFGTKISDIVESVEILDLKTLRISKLTKEQCKFSLKNSIFKKNKKIVITSAVLKFSKSAGEEARKKIKEFLDYRRAKHPSEFPSAGSVFVNPEKKITNKKILEKFPEIIDYNKKGVIASGYLIAKCGLAGRKIGGAQISDKHSNFIINKGNARARDVLALMKLARNKVKKVFGINLETEIQLIGF